MKTIENQTPTTAVTCGKNHDGNQHLTFGACSKWECDGCGCAYTLAEVASAEKNTPHGVPAKVGRNH